jgi:non-heme chloroperoxidase
VILVGWSLGALEALSYCEKFGEKKLAGVVIVDSSVGEGPRPAPGSGFSRRLRTERAAVLSEFAHEIFRAPRDESEIQQIIQSAKRMPLEASIALLNYPVPREHWKQVVLALRSPLLYAVTSQYALQASQLQEHRPATVVALFAESGHALFADDPARFNRLLGDFVASITQLPDTLRR